MASKILILIWLFQNKPNYYLASFTVLSVCKHTAAKRYAKWWLCTPNVVWPRSYPSRFFSLLSDLPPFLLSLPTIVLAKWLRLCSVWILFPSTSDSSASWPFPRLYVHLFCISCVSRFAFGLKSDLWHCFVKRAGRKCALPIWEEVSSPPSMCKEFSWVFFLMLSPIAQVYK